MMVYNRLYSIASGIINFEKGAKGSDFMFCSSALQNPYQEGLLPYDAIRNMRIMAFNKITQIAMYNQIGVAKRQELWLKS